MSGRKKRQSGTATGSVDPATGTASGSVSTMSTMSTMTTTTSPMAQAVPVVRVALAQALQVVQVDQGDQVGHQNPVNQVNHVVDQVEVAEEVEAQEKSVLEDQTTEAEIMMQNSRKELHTKRPLLPLDHRTLICKGSVFSNISSAIFALID
ncbi:unnamed protein product [Caenorhabditis nigoni]